MKAYEGRYDEKYTWLKSMGGFFDDILRFADYIPVVLSHTIRSFLFHHLIHHSVKKPSWLNTHIRNIHAWFSLLESSRYIYTHFISPVLVFIFLLSPVFCGPRFTLQMTRKFPSIFSVSCFKYKYLYLGWTADEAQESFFIRIIYARTYTRSYPYDIILQRSLYVACAFIISNFS